MKKKLLIAIPKSLSSRSNRNFTPKPNNHLYFEVCYSVDPLEVQRRGWSHAASVPSEVSDAQKRQKRVSRRERRAMVESFVNKYRADNAGKFPKVSDARKQLGGSFYVLREIIQELAHKSKMNSSNNVGEILVEKQFDQSKILTTESVNVSSGNIDVAKDRPMQDDSKSVVLDDKEAVNTCYDNLEETRGPQTSYWEKRLSEEIEVVSTPSNHCSASESDIVEKFSKEPYPSSIHMPNDIKTEQAVSTDSDSIAPEIQLLQEEIEQFSPSISKNYGTGYNKAQAQEYDFVDMDNHQKVEEKCITKVESERREQPDLGDLSTELSYSRLQVPNDTRSGEALSSSSGSVPQERHLLKEESEQFPAPFIEKSVSEGNESKFVDIENHSPIEKKSFEETGYETKDQDAVDGPKHEIEQSQRSLELDASKISNNRETSVEVGSEKSTLWGNLKSFANGFINIWKKL